MKPNSLLREVFFTRIEWRLLIILSSLITAILGLLGPFFQKEFVDRLTNHVTPWSAHFFAEFPVLGFIGLAFICILLGQIFQQLTAWLGSRESFLMQRIFAQKVYDKTLSLRVDTMTHRPIGEIVQLYAQDVPGATVFLDQTLPSGASTLFPLILAPVALSLLFDISILPIVGVMVLLISLNSFMAFRQSRFFFRFKQLAGERIGLVNEWIQNIRTIRILGWTRYFEEKIFQKREVETLNRISMVTNGQIMNSLSSSVTFLLNVAALLTLILFSKKSVTPGELLALLWIVGVFLTRPFRQMPWFFTFAFDSWTSLKRLQNFLDIKNEMPHYPATSLPLNQQTKADSILSVRGLQLRIGNRGILKNINFDIKRNEFVAIVGEVGSGKSMLLLSLLGETGAHFDHYQASDILYNGYNQDQLRSQFAYVPQEGFIMSATLRENVAFIYDISQEQDPLIEESLLTAQFNLDSERVAAGLNTEIGERGVNLSGGQRQRVSLARVHFEKAPILLLDDCLSAVDIETEHKLLEQLTKGAWKDRTRILVTHRLTVLPQVDRILFFKEGQLMAEGTYSELLNSNKDFQEFTISVASNEVEQHSTNAEVQHGKK